MREVRRTFHWYVCRVGDCVGLMWMFFVSLFFFGGWHIPTKCTDPRVFTILGPSDSQLWASFGSGASPSLSALVCRRLDFWGEPWRDCSYLGGGFLLLGSCKYFNCLIIVKICIPHLTTPRYTYLHMICIYYMHVVCSISNITTLVTPYSILLLLTDLLNSSVIDRFTQFFWYGPSCHVISQKIGQDLSRPRYYVYNTYIYGFHHQGSDCWGSHAILFNCRVCSPYFVGGILCICFFFLNREGGINDIIYLFRVDGFSQILFFWYFTFLFLTYQARCFFLTFQIAMFHEAGQVPFWQSRGNTSYQTGLMPFSWTALTGGSCPSTPPIFLTTNFGSTFRLNRVTAELDCMLKGEFPNLLKCLFKQGCILGLRAINFLTKLEIQVSGIGFSFVTIFKFWNWNVN